MELILSDSGKCVVKEEERNAEEKRVAIDKASAFYS